MGLAARAFGLTIDNLVGVQIVTADGRIRTVNKSTDPDLLWALRGGGGGNFGIVTQFVFNIHPLPRTTTYFSSRSRGRSRRRRSRPGSRGHRTRRSQLTSIFHINGAGSPSVSANGQCSDPRALRRLLGPLLRRSPAHSCSTTTTNYLVDAVAARRLLGTQPHRTATRSAPAPAARFSARASRRSPTTWPSRCPRPLARVLIEAAESTRRDARIGRDPVRLLRRRDQPRRANRHRVRAPQSAVRGPVSELQRRWRVARPDLASDAPVRLGPGLPELHRRPACRTGSRRITARIIPG